MQYVQKLVKNILLKELEKTKFENREKSTLMQLLAFSVPEKSGVQKETPKAKS